MVRWGHNWGRNFTLEYLVKNLLKTNLPIMLLLCGSIISGSVESSLFQPWSPGVDLEWGHCGGV